MARVAYPDDDNAQMEFVTVILFKLLLASEGEGHDQLFDTVKPFIPNVVYSRPPDEVLRTHAESLVDGWVAGRLLLFLLSAMTHHRELRPSVTKGIEVLTQLYRDAVTRKGANLYNGKSTLWEKWRRFKPVAHFHAQLQHAILTGENEQVDSRAVTRAEANLQSKNFPVYLARAEAFRLLAEQLHIVEPGELWSVPSDVVLPTLEFNPAPLSELELAALRDYRPPHSKRSLR